MNTDFWTLYNLLFHVLIFSLFFRCSDFFVSEINMKLRFTDYCPSPAPVSWTIIVGLALYLISFAAGIAPIPWTGKNLGHIYIQYTERRNFPNTVRKYGFSSNIFTWCTGILTFTIGMIVMMQAAVTFCVAVNSEIYPMWARTLCTRFLLVFCLSFHLLIFDL